MLIQSPALSDQIARLRIAAQAEEPRAWLPAAVHAVITAILVRLFGRLEQMLLLWQSGTLPALPSRDTPHRAAAVAPRHRPARRIARRTRHTPHHQRTRTAAPRAFPVPHAPGIVPQCTHTRPTRRQSARAPPFAIDLPICRESPPLRGRANAPSIISILEFYIITRSGAAG